jgi:2-polyprenyl-6-methoxyphenol hydroxylase-like FAD-dependent oxidoreductase
VPRALVIGGSVGGLVAANLLRTIGWDVEVFERAEGDLGDRGTGVGTRDELFAVLARAGVRLDASIGVDVRSRLCLDCGGSIVHEVPLAAVTSSWARIYRPLKRALPPHGYRAGALLTRIEQDARGVMAIFADGARASGELLIAADGLHSTVRRQFLPQAQPRYAGYVAWRGVADERTVPPALHALLFRHMIFGFPEAGMVLSIPMPAPADDAPAGTRACHYVWFRPADAEVLAALCTDAAGRRHGASIPPPLIRPELIAEVKARAAALLAPQIARMVGQTAQPILQPIFDLESPRIAFGRALLLGDAAFVARPHVATGVMKAALDAQALADALAASGNDVATALARYEHARRPFGQWLVARGRHIGAHLEAQLEWRGDHCDALKERIRTIMREYGAAGIVADEAITARKLP